MEVPDTSLNAGYADGHVEAFRTPQLVPLSTAANSVIYVPNQFD